MKSLHFLAGLPRSGSTLLQNILNQNPNITATATSGVIDLLGALVTTYENNPTFISESKDEINSLLLAVLKERYKENEVVIDKSRGWVKPGIMETMTKVLGYTPKIIATVRPIPDCVSSFIKLIKPNDIKEFIKTHPVMGHLKYSYEALKEGYEQYPDYILFIEYDNLITNPEIELKRIYDFLELDWYIHNFNNIESTVIENDEEAWGIKDLHTIRPKLEKTSANAKEVLGDKLYKFFDVEECWNPNKTKNDTINLLDEAVNYALMGDFINAENLINMQLELEPDDNRAKFNKGWYELAKGNLNKGMRLLACGREENVFGNLSPSNMPLWLGQDLKDKTVLLNLEGGLGDQICNARFAKNINKLGAKVIARGSAELAKSLLQIPSIIAYVDNEVGCSIYHDYWIPSMSAALLLGLEYSDLDNSPYLPSIHKEPDNKLRVGIRWAGNPEFEHEQYRRFDPTPLFELPGVDLISLQRDSDIIPPDYIDQPNLDTWENTIEVINSLDIIITSCTSIAHMAAAMGKITWIIVPILPYYIWAIPGEHSPWYKSVRLFRQTKKGEWDNVFKKIKQELERKINSKKY